VAAARSGEAHAVEEGERGLASQSPGSSWSVLTLSVLLHIAAPALNSPPAEEEEARRAKEAGNIRATDWRSLRKVNRNQAE
jgi:hypothetical protein